MLCVVWSYALCCMELCSVFHRAMFLVIWSYAPYCMELCSVSCGTMLLQLWAPLPDYPDGRLRYFSFFYCKDTKKSWTSRRFSQKFLNYFLHFIYMSEILFLRKYINKKNFSLKFLIKLVQLGSMQKKIRKRFLLKLTLVIPQTP